MGYAQAEVLRRVNAALGGELPWQRYESVVKFGFAEEVLATGSVGPRAAIPVKRLALFAAQSGAMIDALARAGYDVIGDLEELRVDPDGAAPKNLALKADLVQEASIEALVLMLRRDAARDDRSVRLRFARSRPVRALRSWVLTPGRIIERVRAGVGGRR